MGGQRGAALMASDVENPRTVAYITRAIRNHGYYGCELRSRVNAVISLIVKEEYNFPGLRQKIESKLSSPDSHNSDETRVLRMAVESVASDGAQPSDSKREIPIGDLDIPSAKENPAKVAEQRELSEKLLQALERLDPISYRGLIDIYMNGSTQANVGRDLRLDRRRINEMLKKAVVCLADIMREHRESC
jgi:hypothetical protein